MEKYFLYSIFTSDQMRESNPGQLGEKRECYLSAMPYPQAWSYLTWELVKDFGFLLHLEPSDTTMTSQWCEIWCPCFSRSLFFALTTSDLLRWIPGGLRQLQLRIGTSGQQNCYLSFRLVARAGLSWHILNKPVKLLVSVRDLVVGNSYVDKLP